MLSNKLSIATRTSKLALAQTNIVKQMLLQNYPWLQIEVIAIKTTGDNIIDTDLTKVGGKGLFIKELEEQLLLGNADLAVHSMKDVPAQLPEQLTIAAILPRANPYDVLLSNQGFNITDLPPGAVVGTSSLRRQAQLLALRSDLQIKLLRGNVDTRISKLHAQQYDAIILAKAGIDRLQIVDLGMQQLSPQQMLPAVGQGAIGIECRKHDTKILELLTVLHDPHTAICVHAERSMNAFLNGSCSTPIAGFAEIIAANNARIFASANSFDNSHADNTSSFNANNEHCLLQLTGMVAEPNGSKLLLTTLQDQIEINTAIGIDLKGDGTTAENLHSLNLHALTPLLNQAENLGKRVALDLLAQGADAILT